MAKKYVNLHFADEDWRLLRDAAYGAGGAITDLLRLWIDPHLEELRLGSDVVTSADEVATGGEGG